MMPFVLTLRVFVHSERATETVDALRDMPAVHNLVHLEHAEVEHGDDLITAELDVSAANEVVDRLRSLRITRPGAVVLIRQDRTEVMPVEHDDGGYWDRAADAVVVEEVVDEAREHARLSLTYLAYMATAGIVAGVGVGLDSPVLIVGAMAISPDLLPLSAIGVGLVARARRTVLVGLRTLAAGLAVASIAAGLGAWLADSADVLTIDLRTNVLTAFVAEPSAATVIVALAAGVAAMLSIERMAAAAIGVAISVTTIPAAAAIGVAMGQRDWDRMADASLVLGSNVVAIAIAGSLTLWLQLRRDPDLHMRSMHGTLVAPARRQTSTRPPARQ
jgi:uncharacterized hydrophobic protein (TIGR00271 family)